MDYGLFAIVFIHYILAENFFFHSSMRNHASNCLNNDDLEMFPESENFPKKGSKEKVIQLAIYCHCRQVWVESDKGIFER